MEVLSTFVPLYLCPTFSHVWGRWPHLSPVPGRRRVSLLLGIGHTLFPDLLQVRRVPPYPHPISIITGSEADFKKRKSSEAQDNTPTLYKQPRVRFSIDSLFVAGWMPLQLLYKYIPKPSSN